MAKTISIAGVRYRILPLAPARRGPRYLLRNDAGDIFGLFERHAAPTRLDAIPLAGDFQHPNPLARIDFFDSDGKLIARA